MSDSKNETLLIKRYASRRLYNTETSDYVTLDDISVFIREGRDVQIIDLKSGDDLTRQYLLQIIAENESKGESVLPLDVLTDLVRSYTTEVNSVVPQFLAQSFEMLRGGPAGMMDNIGAGIPKIPGMEALQAQQEVFLKAMTGGMSGVWPPQSASAPKDDDAARDKEDLATIKQQLAELQEKLSKIT
ncbi:polyhydroxyalkanoate synthesis repressor PhaR [Pacificibacter maritimus]|uniref:Polyhydroxyalkanoate synthesis repressor PhaR n=1 Tax=Pacificibacter maritimus TaxID=762213 RepID=A0A3N4UU53_9RHOB|nr:polyhydroxyalkanoate synthesis repressor PhaR [Pacificibacter maritimus]RPE71009.1 polyhydroxyalkanoate synthesis repressor PhaR [Pacificibacter maritimus]